MLHYAQILTTQMTQTAICNRHHMVEQRLCRWLLLRLDRLSSDRLILPQEPLANMLGVHSAGVAEAIRNLQHAGLIRYGRDHIEVLDKPGLEKAVCECYAMVKMSYSRLLADISQGDHFFIHGQPKS